MSDNERSAPVPSLPRKERDDPMPAWTREAADEFQRFEDLSRRLVTVPKKEVDKKRKRQRG